MEAPLEIDEPTISQCPVHYECRIIHRNRVDPSTLAVGAKSSYYPEVGIPRERSGRSGAEGDYHTVYWGEIVGAFRRA